VRESDKLPDTVVLVSVWGDQFVNVVVGVVVLLCCVVDEDVFVSFCLIFAGSITRP
jgi:hypothetical protein